MNVESRHFGRVRVCYRKSGAGPPLLLIHGLMTTGYSFRYIVGPLAERYTVILPDLPGAGSSDKPAVTYGPEETADFLGEFIDALDMCGCAAIGNSMGGYLAMWLALRNPRALSRLVNIHSPATPLFRLHALRAALSLPATHQLLGRLINIDPHGWVHRNVHYYDETLKSVEELHEYASPLETSEGVRAFHAILRDTMNPNRLRRFGRVLADRRRQQLAFPVPLMLVYAERDPMVPPKVGHALAALVPEAELVWLQRCSHFVQVDAPDRLMAATHRFLSERNDT